MDLKQHFHHQKNKVYPTPTNFFLLQIKHHPSLPHYLEISKLFSLSLLSPSLISCPSQISIIFSIKHWSHMTQMFWVDSVALVTFWPFVTFVAFINFWNGLSPVCQSPRFKSLEVPDFIALLFLLFSHFIKIPPLFSLPSLLPHQRLHTWFSALAALILPWETVKFLLSVFFLFFYLKKKVKCLIFYLLIIKISAIYWVPTISQAIC